MLGLLQSFKYTHLCNEAKPWNGWPSTPREREREKTNINKARKTSIPLSDLLDPPLSAPLLSGLTARHLPAFKCAAGPLNPLHYNSWSEQLAIKKNEKEREKHIVSSKHKPRHTDMLALSPTLTDIWGGGGTLWRIFQPAEVSREESRRSFFTDRLGSLCKTMHSCRVLPASLWIW